MQDRFRELIMAHIRSALTDAVTNAVQNDADIDEEIQNAQDTVEFNISE